MTTFLKNIIGSSKDSGIRATIDLSFCYVEFTPKGQLLDCNENFASLFGFDPKELKGIHHSSFVPTHYSSSKEYELFWQELARGVSKSGEFHRIRKDGESIFINAAYTPVKNSAGKITSVIKIASDVTAERNSSYQFRAIKDSIDLSYAYIRFDVSGNIIDANAIFLETMGYGDLREIEGRHHAIFVESTYAKSVEYEKFWEDLGVGKVHSGEFSRVDKKGKIVWLQASYSPVYNHDGEITSIVKIASDITDKRILADLAKDLKNTIDLSFGYIQFDPKGTILDVNENFYKLLGYDDRDEVHGKHHSIFVEENFKKSDEYHNFWSELNKGKTQDGRFKRVAKNGNEVWIQAAYTPLQSETGEVLSIVKIAADITASKLDTERAKKELKDELFQNISEISSAISEIASGARTQAEKIDQSSESIESSLATSKEVSEKAEQIAETAAEGKGNSLAGDKHVRELVTNMANLSDTALRTERSMQELTKKTEEVNFILNVMQEIANNTNLLALNAAIEASKAGDAGRGFAVIAQEIRMLAENARNSVSEIEEKILSVNKDSQEVGEAMKEVSEKVGASKDATESVKEMFDRIQQSSEQTAKLSDSIVAASTNQNNKLKQLVGTSEEIVVISEETAAGTEQVSTASKELESKVSQF